MSDATLRDLVLKRLEADTQPDDEWAALVLAALESPEELDQLLADGNGTAQKASPGQAPTQDPAAPQKPPRTAFLRRITAQGFRGIGPQATLDLTPGPGLTLVVGRNGSGKSSFAEGLELLLTGDTYRWSQRSKVPFFLSYNELGSLLDEGPSKLYDALSNVLGLDADATVIEVTRREGSFVDTRRSKDPVSRYLDDAFALAKTDDLPPDIARRVILGGTREQRVDREETSDPYRTGIGPSGVLKVQ